MRILSFVKKASRAKLLTNRVSPDLLKSIKSFTPDQVKEVLRGFVPLDFVALLRHENPSAFDEALRSIISQKLNITQYKKWLEELGLDKEEAISEIFVAMLSNDPKKRGILSEISLDGSYGDAFQYARKDDPELKLTLKQNAAPISNTNGIVVPFCPVDKKLGLSVPLWSISQSGHIESNLDAEGKCLTYDVLGTLSTEEFEEMVQTHRGLTEEQKVQLDSGDRELVRFDDGTVALHCTFQTQLPKFSNFLDFRMKGIITSILSPERRKMGRNIPPEKYKRRDILEQKEKDKTLTAEEGSELRALRNYFQKKNVQYVPSATSLDMTMKGDEGDGKSLHDVVTTQESESDLGDSEEAIFELERKLGDDFSKLARLSGAIPVYKLFEKMNQLSSLSSKDPKRKEYEQQIASEALSLAQKYISKGKDTPNITCYICNESFDKPVESCPNAMQMRRQVSLFYSQSDSFSEFKEKISGLAPKAKSHYDASSLSSKVDSIYQNVEFTEDELDDIDFSTFQSFESDEPASSHTKLDDRTFQSTLDQKLDEKQKQAYRGTTIKTTTSQITSEEQAQAAKLASTMKSLLDKVFINELEEEFTTFLLTQGVN